MFEFVKRVFMREGETIPRRDVRAAPEITPRPVSDI